MTRTTTTILGALIALGTLAALSVAEPPISTCGSNEPVKCSIIGAGSPHSLINTVGITFDHAEAVDGDTIRVGGVRVRLWGMDAPESRQTCLDAQGASYACGEAATRALAHMLDRDPYVACVKWDIDRYNRPVAVCSNGEGDLGTRMVATGWAIDYTRYSGGFYRDQEEAAKAEHLGIWSGTFTQPEQWRRENPR